MVLVVTTVSLVAHAEKKTVVLASGDCADPALVSSAKDFRDSATRMLGSNLMDAETVLDIVRPRALRSLQDIERQLESGRALFYGGQPERADEILDRVIEQLDRAPAESAVWPVYSGALILKALVAKNAEKTREMNDAFRHILRVDPGFKLDPDAYPPSALTAFEAVRKEVQRSRKSAIQIRVDSGPAATVFLDGHAVGQTPLKLDLVAGSYRVMLANGAMVSFPHKLDVPRDGKLSIDFAFEGSVSKQPPLCLEGGSEASAVKLAQLVTAEQVIVLRNTARRGDPAYISGALYNLGTGQQERTGSVQPNLIGNLATFIVTGKPTPGVGSPNDPPPSAPPAVTVAPVANGDSNLTPGAVTTPEPLSPVAPSKSNGARIASAVIAGLGGVAIITGIVSYASFAEQRSTFELLANGGRLPPLGGTAEAARRSQALALLTQIQSNTTLSFALIGGGVGLAAAGLLGVVLFPDSPAQLSVAPSAGGASFSVTGRF